MRYELNVERRPVQMKFAEFIPIFMRTEKMSVELKIKVKNLADEARTIRKEEQKLHGMEKWKLQHHRKTIVRDVARRSLMAYQICRRRDWESSASRDRFTRMSDIREVTRMVKKYGTAEAINSLPQIEETLRL